MGWSYIVVKNKILLRFFILSHKSESHTYEHKAQRIILEEDNKELRVDVKRDNNLGNLYITSEHDSRVYLNCVSSISKSLIRQVSKC